MTIIAFLFKPSITKACISFLIVFALASMPHAANAGFFSKVSKVLGANDTAAETLPEPAITSNSQTMPLLEPTSVASSSTNKGAMTIDSGEALVLNSGPLGPTKDIEEYVSNATINTYTVKKGDTISGIAKKFKVSENSIVYSNADLKKSDLLKVGQVLAIMSLKTETEAPKIAAKPALKDAASEKQTKQPEPKPVAIEDEGPLFTINTDTPLSNVESLSNNQTPTQQEPELDTPTGQPSGTIIGGYIWPFPDGVGRVSQGIHADQAYDFAAPKGTPIYAIQGGTVLIARPSGYNGGYGLYVVINFDDGRQAIFGHMSKVIAKAGDVVKQGDVIGYVGSTGKSTGPHVHIGFHGTLKNPYLGLKVNSRDLAALDAND
jgi:murein DD-endopeptidase MepM/ murein hydrolase activator NlpD